MSNEDVYTKFKSSVDLGMGIIYMVVSYYASQTAFIIEEYGLGLVYTISLLFFLYGVFRIYRGFIALKAGMKPRNRSSNALQQRYKEREAAIKQDETEKPM